MQNTVNVVYLILIVAIYLLPTIIAFARDVPRRGQIAFVNILFGWTIIGWWAAFFWAAFARGEPAEA